MTHTTDTELLAALHALLDQALDLAPGEREAWFARLRIERPVHAAELEALLAAEPCLDARGFLSVGPFTERTPPPGLAGQRLGAYTLERPLGQGGMGSVWLARRSDGRYEGTAAVKLLNLALLDPVGSERFRREGSALARLSHPNIARLLDAGVTDGGQPFLVLEHVEGTRIDCYCDDRRLGPAERIGLFLQVLAAVAHAHANLLVHRDLKPSNILVTPDGTVKLLDFGIAKLLEDGAPGAEASTLTDLGGRALTPEYAAPEQIAGRPITTATDVYALGVLLYLLLAGRHPTGEGCQSSAEYISGVLGTDPPRLSAAVATSGTLDREHLARSAIARGATVERLKRLYAGDLDNIVAKALKKTPEERYGSVTAFADDLRRYLDHQPVSARPDSVSYRMAKFVRRHRASVLAGSLTLAALVAATVVTTSEMLEARRQRDAARSQRDKAIYHDQRATATTDFMEFLLESVAPTGKAYTMRQLLDQGRGLLETEYSEDPRFVARMMVELAGFYFQLRDHEREEALLARADELATRADDPETVAYANCRLSQSRADDGAVELARANLGRALRHLSRVREPSATIRAQCLRARSGIARIMGQPDSALASAREAVALFQAAGDTGSVRYGDALNELRGALEAADQFRAALEVTRRSIGLLERIGRGRTLTMVVERSNEANLLLELGEVLAGDSALARAIELASGMDPEQPLPPYLTNLAGDVAAALGRPDSAVARFTQVIALVRPRGDVPSQVWALYGLCRALLDQRSLAEAGKCRDELSRVVPARGRWRLEVVDARLAEARGHLGQAHRLLANLLASRGFPNHVVQTWDFPLIVLAAARTALGTGDAMAAESLAQHALELAAGEGQDETRSGAMGYALLVLGRVRRANGDVPAARARLERAWRALAHGYGWEHPRTLEARALLDSLSRR